MQVVNLFGDDWDSRRDRPGWLWNRADVGKRAGAELFGISLYESSRGRRSFRTTGSTSRKRCWSSSRVSPRYEPPRASSV